MEPQINAATEAARTAAEGLGAQGSETTAQQIRDALQNRLAAIKANESRLWQAVDPDNSLSVVTSPLKRATDSIYGDMGPEKAATLAPVEKQLAGIVGDYGPTLPFQRLTDLRSAVSSAMRQARSPLQPNEAAYGRLSQLRGAIEDAITDSVTGKVAEEQAAAQAGALAPEQGILGRWASDVSGAQGVGRTVGRAAENPGPTGAGTESVLPAEIRAGSEGLGEPAGTEGNPQGPGNLVDTAAAERLNQASAATKERKATFGAEPVNKILQRPGATYPYTASADTVANHLWRLGAKGAGNIRAILKAADNAPDAVEAIRSAAASSLKAKAEKQLADIYAKLDPWQKTQVARHQDRPRFRDYVGALVTDFIELSGDRKYGEDAAILGGTGKFMGRPVVVVGAGLSGLAAALHLARQDVDRNDYKEAERELRWVLDQKPGEAERALAVTRLARVLAAQKQFDAALQESKEAARLDPNLLAPHEILSAIYAQRKQMDDAENEYRAAMHIYQTVHPDYQAYNDPPVDPIGKH